MNDQPTATLPTAAEPEAGQAPEVSVLDDLLADAVALHSQGKLEEAEAIYRIVLGSDPDQPDALHLLGVIASQVGRDDVAIDLIGRSIAVQPGFAEAHYNLGAACYRLRRLDRAEAAFRVAVELEPDNADAWSGRGNALSALGRHDEAVASCRRAAEIDPESATIQNNLANALKRSGEMREAADACRRALALDPGYEPALQQQKELAAFLERRDQGDDIAPLRLLGGIVIPWLRSQASGSILTGVSSDLRGFVKIELFRNPDKRNPLDAEMAIMRHLNAAGAVTCPEVLATGVVTLADLLPCLDDRQKARAETAGRTEFPYVVQAYIGNDEGWTLADMMLAYLEQKALGVYQGDPRPENLRFDPGTGICYLIDYDQAEFLPDSIRQASNVKFLEWCSLRAAERYGFSSWLDYFPKLSVQRDIEPLFRKGAFDMGTTTLWRSQQTTLSAGGIYHRIDTDRVFADGERDLSGRREILDRIAFAPGERVLDVGCNAGLLSLYLDDRGCRVHGVELDPCIVRGARIVANILGRDIRYDCLDLDREAVPDSYDTIMLFSVIHHTRNLEANGRAIAEHCRRIVIECRLQETGAKPEDGTWVGTSKWRYATFDEMVAGLEALFPGFGLAANHGQVDRDRYILEFAKD